METNDDGKQKRRPRGSGKARHVGRKTKRTERSVECAVGGGSDDSVSLSSSNSSLGQALEGRVCDVDVDEPHICIEGDNFSETTFGSAAGSDTFSSSDENEDHNIERITKVKRRKKRSIGYKRKRSSASSTSASFGSDDESGHEDQEHDLDVEVLSDVSLTGLSDEDLASLSIPKATGDEPCRTSNEECNDPPKSDEEVKALYTALKDQLKLLLSGDWSIDKVKDNILRLIHLNESKNAVVKSCIYYDMKKNMLGVFIQGKPMQKSHKIFQELPHVDFKNLGNVSDFLTSLANKILTSKMCSGIEDYAHLWHSMDGSIDAACFSESACYRSSSCHLLLDKNKENIESCQNCQQDARKMKRREEFNEQTKQDPFAIPDKLLTKEAIKTKKDKYKKMARLEAQKAKRLEARLELAKVKLDKVLKDDLLGVLLANQDKMSSLQKTFWESQAKAVQQDDMRGMRWHPMVIRIALHLHASCPNAIEVLNDLQILKFPTQRRLYDYSHFIDPEEGCQEEIISDMKKKIEKCGTQEHHKFVNLMFDEMNIRSGLVTRRSTGELVGYTSLANIDKEIAQLQSELEMKVYKPKLAKKVLVYLAEGITSTVKDAVAVYSTDDLSAVQLHDRTWDVIYHLENADIKVLSLTCDGAAINRKFFQMHDSLDPSSKYVYCTKNLAAGDGRPLYFIIDPPHLLKTIRNAFANSFCHKKSRQLWKNGETMSWKVIENLYEMSKGDEKRGHKLTKAHVQLTAFSCMTVKYATQVLSDSVAKSISRAASHRSIRAYDTSEMVKFIQIMNKFFDCMNGKEEEGDQEKNPDKLNYRDPDDRRLSWLENDFLNFFEDWKRDIKNRPGVFTEAERNQMILSHQALGALETTVKGVGRAICFMLQAGAPSVSARIFNQDPIEQYFSKVRRAQGDNRNPTLPAVLDTRLSLKASGLIELTVKKGNTEGSKRKDYEVDDTPLLSRKVQRKE